MAWNPDDDPPPFDELFRQIQRMMEEMVEGMDESAWQGGFDVAGARQGSPDRDVHVDFHEEGEALRVVADLPGVAEDDIEVKSNGEVLTIRASSDTREYRERIDLPVAVDEETARATYNNGVLEVAFETGADDGTVIEVE